MICHLSPISDKSFNGIGNKNLRSIQDVMRASKPAMDKFKRFCKDCPNLAILTKSATPGEIQLMFGHAAVGNKSLGEFVVAFVLTGDLSLRLVPSQDVLFALILWYVAKTLFRS